MSIHFGVGEQSHFCSSTPFEKDHFVFSIDRESASSLQRDSTLSAKKVIDLNQSPI